MRSAWKRLVLGVLGFLLIVAMVLAISGYGGWAWRRLGGGYSVDDRLRQFGPVARARWRGHFDAAGAVYPPDDLVLVGIKQTRVLEVWSRHHTGPFTLVRTMPIVAASGTLGPKLREGDRQVPEGLYRVESLHPNSLYHLALRVNYPNDFDRAQAQLDGRTRLGGDIMIHGSNGSVGCLAMGDEAAEDLFVLVADTGLQRTRIIFAPVDLRVSGPPTSPELPTWTPQLYERIREAMLPLTHGN